MSVTPPGTSSHVGDTEYQLYQHLLGIYYYPIYMSCSAGRTVREGMILVATVKVF